jgi:hypothetical protein
MEGVALDTRSRAKSAELEEGVLTALKINPGQCGMHLRLGMA